MGGIRRRQRLPVENPLAELHRLVHLKRERRPFGRLLDLVAGARNRLNLLFDAMGLVPG